MTEAALMLLIATGAVAMIDWRHGLTMCVIVGIAQDPLRKIAPGQPIIYVVLVVVVLVLTLVRAHLARVNLSPTALGHVRKDLKLAFSLYLGLVFFQAMHSFVAYRSFLMTGIGLLVWLSPIPAVVLAYQFALRRGIEGVRHWMELYSLFAIIALAGVYLEYLGFEWRTLGEVGEGLMIFDVGTVLKAHAGFFRSSEIAAWHTAAVSCIVFTLSVGKRSTLLRFTAAFALVSVLVSLGMLTGRRKMLMEIIIFLGTFLFLYASVQRGAARLAVSAVVASIIGYVLVVGLVAPDLVRHDYTKTMDMSEANLLERYAMRSQSVFAELPRRVAGLGLEPVLWSVEAHGWLGAGLGSGSQGAQGVAEQHGIHWGAAEGGLGKVAIELGVPGIPLIIWLLLALARQIREQLLVTSQLSAQHRRISFGLISFLVANLAAFSIATQAFSDPFILILMGWSLGFLFAMPVLAYREALRASAQREAVARVFAPTLPGGSPHLPPVPAARMR